MDYAVYIFILLSTISSISAQYLFKLSYKKSDYKFVPVGIILYALVGFLSFKVLNFLHLGLANVISHLFYFISLFLVGYLFFDEKLTKKQIMASIFGIISLFLFMSDGLQT